MTSTAAPKKPRDFPRVNSVIVLIIAVVALALAALFFWLGISVSSFLGPAFASLVVAALCAWIGILGFRVVSLKSNAMSLARTLRLVAIAAVVFGIVGTILGSVFGAIEGSTSSIEAGFAPFALSIVTFVQAALIYRAAEHSAVPV